MIKERLQAKTMARMEVLENIFDKATEICDAKDKTLDKLEKGGRIIDIVNLLDLCVENGGWILSHNEGIAKVVTFSGEEFEFKIKGVDEVAVEKLIALSIATKVQIIEHHDDDDIICEILDIFFDEFYELIEVLLKEILDNCTECISFVKGL